MSAQDVTEHFDREFGKVREAGSLEERMEGLSAVQGELESLNARALETRKELFTGVLESIFDEYPEVQFIEVLGSTPSFNDGDPCVHDHTFSINESEVEEEFYDDDYSDDPEPANLQSDQAPNGSQQDSAPPELNSEVEAQLLKHLELFNDVVIAKFDTNFRVRWERSQSGGLKEQKEGYDCGY